MRYRAEGRGCPAAASGLVLALALLLAAGARAQEAERTWRQDLHLALQPFVTVRWGEQGEYVYQKVDGADSQLLSYLEWEQKPLLMGGITAEAGFKGLFGFFTAEAALPRGTGTVYDSDWLNVSLSPGCADEYASIKTHYTESRNELEEYYRLSGGVGYTFWLGGIVSIAPFAELDYEYSSYYAMGLNGSYYDTTHTESNSYYGWYDDAENSSAVAFDDDVRVLRLQRIQYAAWAGCRNAFRLGRRWTLGCGWAVSPYIYMQSLDTHPLRDQYFLDILSGRFCAARLDGQVSFAFTRHHALVLSAEYLATGILTGTTRYRTSTTGAYTAESSAESGADVSYVSASLAYRFTLN